MAYSKLHDQEYPVRFRKGTRTNLNLKATAYSGEQGWPYYVTDTKQLFIHDGTAPYPVLSLDMALVDRATGDVLTDRDAGEIMWSY